MSARISALKHFFSPRAIVVYGAMDDVDKPGGRLFSLLQRYGRPVYAIHPTLEHIAESPVFRSALSLPKVPDLAILAVSARNCEEVLRDALEAGVKAAIILASGFSETGTSGAEAEGRLKSLAQEKGARLLGPNTLGVFVPHKLLDTIFVEHGDRSLLPGGSIAVVSQSGAVGVEALGYASSSGFGLRAFAGLGNKCDVDELDMAAWFSRDEGTRVLGFYLEDLVDGRAFLQAIWDIGDRKPVVVLKGGRTAEGAKAVASHTGALAGSGRVADGAWRQFGVHRVRDDQHFCDTCKVLSLCPPLEGNRVAIITPAGGYGVMAVDSLASLSGKIELRVAKLSPDTVGRLREVLLPFASPHNPVDLTAACTDQTYEKALEILVGAPEVDAILVVAFFAPEDVSSRLVNIIATKNRQYRKPMVVFCLYGPFTDRYLLDFHERGVAAFGSMSRAVEALVTLRERRVFLRRRSSKESPFERVLMDPSREKLIERMLRVPSGKNVMHEADAKALLGCLDIRVPRYVSLFPEQGEDRTAFSTRAAEATNGAGIGYPVVLKVLSEAILHKSEVGGVVRGIGDERELARAIQIMLCQLETERFSDCGILVEEHVDASFEAIVGGLIDAEFGPAIMVGVGGIWSEAYGDVGFRLAPVSTWDVEDLLDELNSARLFRSFRGYEFPRMDFVSLVMRFSEFFYRFSDRIDQMDLNPVAAGPEGITVLDAKVLLR
jgi:acetyltransferase